MPSTSTSTPSGSLQSRIQRQIDQEAQLYEEQTRKRLEQHAKSSSAQWNAWQRSTERSMHAANRLLRQQLKRQLRVMLRLTLLPLLPALLLSLIALTLGLHWAWQEWPLLREPATWITASNGQTYLVLASPDWTTCRTPQGLRPCRPLE